MRSEEKERLRREFLTRRQQMSVEAVKLNSRAIQGRVEGVVRQRGVKTVMAYVSVRNEVETQELIRSLLAQRMRVAVPLCVRETIDLVPCQIEDLDSDLVPGTFGIPEPGEGKQRALRLEDLEVVLVPGVAFDRFGYRLGHGTGYYDRFLRRLSQGVLKVGLAYDWQVVEELPRATHDVPTDFVVTETQIIEAGQSAASRLGV